jgi:hypothetical protein
VQFHVIAYWTCVDAELGSRVAAGLGHPNGASREAASLIEELANRAWERPWMGHESGGLHLRIGAQCTVIR